MFLLLLMRDYAGIKLVFTACVSASAAAVHAAGLLNYPWLIPLECVSNGYLPSRWKIALHCANRCGTGFI